MKCLFLKRNKHRDILLPDVHVIIQSATSSSPSNKYKMIYSQRLILVLVSRDNGLDLFCHVLLSKYGLF